MSRETATLLNSAPPPPPPPPPPDEEGVATETRGTMLLWPAAGFSASMFGAQIFFNAGTGVV